MSTDPNDAKFSLLSLKNSLFLESQLASPDYDKIANQFNLDSSDKASAVFKFYRTIYSTLQTYSTRFTLDYLKGNWTQVGFLNAYSRTEVYTLNNITSWRFNQRITRDNYSCRQIFNISPYLEMCTFLELNIEYFDVIKLFVAAYFNLDQEKDARDTIKRIMNQNDSFLEGLFDDDSKVEFNLLMRDVLEGVTGDFDCGNSCRQILAERQFVYENLFEEQKARSLYDLPGNAELLGYVPEVKSYIDMLLDDLRPPEADSQELTTCDFLTPNVLDFNANSILNVNQLSLFYTYAELNNKYNLLNFLKIRCDPDVLLRTLEYFFVGWGLPNFYLQTQVDQVFQQFHSDFLASVAAQKEIDGGMPSIDPVIDFNVVSNQFRMQALTGMGHLSDLRKLVEIENNFVEDQNMSFIFEALLDYKSFKTVDMLARSVRLASSSDGETDQAARLCSTTGSSVPCGTSTIRAKTTTDSSTSSSASVWPILTSNTSPAARTSCGCSTRRGCLTCRPPSPPATTRRCSRTRPGCSWTGPRSPRRVMICFAPRRLAASTASSVSR